MKNKSSDLGPDGAAAIVAVAEDICNGRVSWLEGSRKICTLRRLVEGSDSEIFYPFIAAESELDHIPEQTKRNLYDALYLKKLDEEVAEYFELARDGLLSACRSIISRYQK